MLEQLKQERLQVMAQQQQITEQRRQLDEKERQVLAHRNQLDGAITALERDQKRREQEGEKSEQQ